jgi:hypothetical protein
MDGSKDGAADEGCKYQQIVRGSCDVSHAQSSTWLLKFSALEDIAKLMGTIS